MGFHLESDAPLTTAWAGIVRLGLFSTSRLYASTTPTHRAPPPTRYFYGPQHAHLENKTGVYMTGEELCSTGQLHKAKRLQVSNMGKRSDGRHDYDCTDGGSRTRHGDHHNTTCAGRGQDRGERLAWGELQFQ